MVKKLFALASVTALTGLVAASSLAGCSDSNDGDGGGGTPDSGAPDVKKDSKTPVDPGDGDVEPESCYDSGSAAILSEKVTANFPGNLCTPAEVDALLAGCFGDGASEAKCEAVQTNSTACYECVLGPIEAKDSFDIPVFLPVGSGGAGQISIYACIAVAIGMPECAIPLTNNSFCPANACATCEDSESKACQEEALQDACKIDLPKDCVDAFNALTDADPAIKMCTGADGLGSLKASANVLCGTGAKVVDGGTDGG